MREINSYYLLESMITINRKHLNKNVTLEERRQNSTNDEEIKKERRERKTKESKICIR